MAEVAMVERYMMNGLLSVLSLVITAIYVHAQPCPEKCLCSSTGYDVYCGYKKLDHFPTYIPNITISL